MSGPANRRHRPVCNSADAIVAAVRDDHRSLRIDGDAHRLLEQRLCQWPVRKSRVNTAGERGDHSGGRDHTDLMIAGIGDVDIAARIDGDACRLFQSRLRAGDRRHDALRG